LALAGAEAQASNFLFVVEQQVRAEKLVVQQNKNLNFLFVYWADVPAENHKLPSHRQCVDVSTN